MLFLNFSFSIPFTQHLLLLNKLLANINQPIDVLNFHIITNTNLILGKASSSMTEVLQMEQE